MQVTWRRKLWKDRARRKRTPLLAFEPASGTPWPARAGRKGLMQWHFDRKRRVREFEERERIAC